MLFSVLENTNPVEKEASDVLSLGGTKKQLKERLNGKPVEMEEFEEMLLHASRNGDHFMVEELLQAKSEGRLTVNVNCKGRTKSNHGWSPLHLASYFGHQTVTELLLKHEADINLRNDAGDTPLHKAAFTGREGIVLLLLQNDADVNLINGEGYTAKDLALDRECRRLLESAEQTVLRKKEEKLLDASREGNIEIINELLKGPSPPNVHSVDAAGNTPLHCAAYRGQKEVAVLLLQNGADPSIRNKRGQRAVDLAQSPQMKQILDVQPIRALQRHVVHFEGPLMKRSRFIGWKNVFVILERGVLTYFGSRADAVCSVNRKGFKHLDGAKVIPVEVEQQPGLVIHFSDNTTHRLRLPSPEIEEVSLQKWMNALQEHISYSSHYISQGVSFVDSEDEDAAESLKLGSLQDVFQTAQAYQQLLERQLVTVENLLQTSNDEEKNDCQNDMQSLRQLAKTSRNMVTSLNHCLNIFMQQEEVHFLQMKQTQEKCRVLEQALHVLAKEHHELEQTLSSTPYHSPKSPWSLRSPRFYDTSDDEFYDAHEGDQCSNSLSRNCSLDTTTTTMTIMTSTSYVSACSVLTQNGTSKGR